MKRRLSRAQNTVLCGRILMFLASVTPLSDKSGASRRVMSGAMHGAAGQARGPLTRPQPGVNLKSSFNTANVTVYDDEEPAEAKPSAGAPSDVAATKCGGEGRAGA